jgi:hypothetical protein
LISVLGVLARFGDSACSAYQQVDLMGMVDRLTYDRSPFT